MRLQRMPPPTTPLDACQHRSAGPRLAYVSAVLSLTLFMGFTPLCYASHLPPDFVWGLATGDSRHKLRFVVTKRNVVAVKITLHTTNCKVFILYQGCQHVFWLMISYYMFVCGDAVVLCGLYNVWSVDAGHRMRLHCASLHWTVAFFHCSRLSSGGRRQCGRPRPFHLGYVLSPSGQSTQQRDRRCVRRRLSPHVTRRRLALLLRYACTYACVGEQADKQVANSTLATDVHAQYAYACVLTTSPVLSRQA